MANRFLFMVAFSSFFVGCVTGQGNWDTVRIPNTVCLWHAEGGTQSYTPDDLYTYIDGAAEVYRSFNVRNVYTRKYVAQGQPYFVLDVFEMDTSADAFGVFRHEMRMGENVGVGYESEYLGGNLAFWKGRYYVEITAYDETPELKKAVLSLARTISEGISEESALPDLLRHCPKEKRLERRIRYFHNGICLNQYRFISDRNLLELNHETEGVLVPYETDSQGHTILIVIRYQSSEKAEKAFATFREGYSEVTENSDHWVTDRGRVIKFILWKNLIIGVFDAPDVNTADLLLNQTLESVKREDGS